MNSKHRKITWTRHTLSKSIFHFVFNINAYMPRTVHSFVYVYMVISSVNQEFKYFISITMVCYCFVSQFGDFFFPCVFCCICVCHLHMATCLNNAYGGDQFNIKIINFSTLMCSSATIIGSAYMWDRLLGRNDLWVLNDAWSRSSPHHNAASRGKEINFNGFSMSYAFNAGRFGKHNTSNS